MTTTHNASEAVTLTLTSLASSSGLTVGRCSAAWSSDGADYAAPSLKTRSGSSTPTANRAIEVWAFRRREDGTWPEIFTSAYTGSDGDFTVVSRDILRAGAVRIGDQVTDATTSRDYVIDCRELGMSWGFVPEEVAFWVTQSTGQNLSSTSGDHELTIKPGLWA